MRSRAEILADSVTPVYFKAKEIEALDAHERAHPPGPPPLTTEQRQQLEKLATDIRAHTAAFTAHVAKEKQMRDRLEKICAELEPLCLSGDPDDDATVQQIIMGRERRTLLQTRLANAPAERATLLSRMVATLRELDGLLTVTAQPKQMPTTYFALQGIPLQKCEQALAAITERLKQP